MNTKMRELVIWQRALKEQSGRKSGRLNKKIIFSRKIMENVWVSIIERSKVKGVKQKMRKNSKMSKGVE